MLFFAYGMARKGRERGSWERGARGSLRVVKPNIHCASGMDVGLRGRRRGRCGGLRERGRSGPARADGKDDDDSRRSARGGGGAEGDEAGAAVRRGQQVAVKQELVWEGTNIECRCACVRPSTEGGRAREPGSYAREERGSA